MKKKLMMSLTMVVCGFSAVVLAEENMFRKDDRGIPELLEFARKYDSSAVKRHPADEIVPSSSDKQVTQFRVQVTQQKKTIERLRRELATLQTHSASVKHVSEIENQLRLAMTEKEKINQELQEVRTALQEKELRVSELEKQREDDVEALNRARQQTEAMQEKEKITESLTDSVKKGNGVLRERLAQLQDRFHKQKEELDRLQKQLAGRMTAKKISDADKKKLDLSTPVARQAYVTGMTLGQNVLSLNQGDALLGMDVSDPAVVLAGFRDMLTGQSALNESAVEETYIARDNLIKQAIKNTIEKEKKAAVSWLEDFKKQPDVKQSPSGLWYRIEYTGDESLPSGDPVVDISVRESLTDGTVINDMELTGAVMSMKLSDYPEVFREVIGLLRQHGRLTVVVPPDRAYGDTGMPPVIPPGATIIYVIQLESPGEGSSIQSVVAGNESEQ